MSDQDRRNYSNNQLVTDLMTGILAQWCRETPNFTEPVINTHARIKAKLKSTWEQGNKVSSGRANLEENDRFMEKLDRLMDILTCKCYIKSCTDVVATLPVLVKYTMYYTYYLEEYEDIMEESVTDYYNEYNY